MSLAILLCWTIFVASFVFLMWLDSCSYPDCFYLQLCKRETLRDYLNANTLVRDKSDIIVIFRQICDAVSYIHSQGLIHRDLKVIYYAELIDYNYY